MRHLSESVQQQHNMSAVRLKSLYYSSENIAYGIEIHDTTIDVDTDIDFDMPISGAPSLQYEGDEDDIFAPILACSASVTMWVETNAHRLFYSDFITAAEGRFYMRCFYIDGVTEVEYFIGKVVHDTAYLEDSELPTFTIRAIDAMMELKTIDYTPVLTLPSYSDIIVKYCLMQSTVTTLFYTNDVDGILHVYNEYISVLQLDATDVLSDTYLANYFKTSSDGQEDKYSCLDVLSEVLRGLGARMYLDRGRYVLEQIRGRDTAAAQYTIYNKLGVKLSTGNTDFDITINDASSAFALAHPRYTFVPPVRDIILSQNGDFIDNLLFARRFGYNESNTAVTIGNLSVLDDDLKVYSRVKIKPHIIKNADYIIGQPKFGYIKMQVRISIGNRYLKGSAKILQTYAAQTYNTSAEDLQWTTLATDTVEIIVPTYVKYNNLQQNANDFIFTIDITSPVIEATGDVIFDIDSDGAFTNSNADTAITSIIPFSNAWESFSSALSILKGLEDSNSTKGTTIIQLQNDTDNTVIYRTEYSMGDFPGTSSINRLRVNDPQVDSTEWTHPDFGNMSFQKLALHDILAVRRQARRKLDINICLKGLFPITPRNRLVYGAKKYIPLSCQMGTAKDAAAGIYFEIGLNKGVIINPPVIIDPYIVDHTGGFQDNTSGGGVNNLLGNTEVPADGYYQLVASATGDNVDVSDYEGLPDPTAVTGDSIRKSLKVYIGGTKQRFNNVAKSLLIVGEFRINYASQLLEWGRDNTGKVIEIDSNENYLPIVPAA